MKLQINFIKHVTAPLNQQDLLPYFTKTIQLHPQLLTIPSIIIDLQTVTSTKIKLLNQKHRQKNQPTDVLSFPIYDPLTPTPRSLDTPLLLGEIFLCPSYIKTHKIWPEKSYPENFLFITIHGLLHLLGYDHPTTQKQQKMNTLTQKIIQETINP